jgi:hypothetical protein
MKRPLIIASFFLRGLLVGCVSGRTSSARFFELTQQTMSTFDEYIDHQEKREARNKELKENIRINMTRNKKTADMSGTGKQDKEAVENATNGANQEGAKSGSKRDDWLKAVKGSEASNGNKKMSSLELAAAAGKTIPQVMIPNLRSQAMVDDELDKKVNEKKELHRNAKKGDDKDSEDWKDIKAKSKTPPKTHEAEGNLSGRFWAQPNDNRFDALSDNEEEEKEDGCEKVEKTGVQDETMEQAGFEVGKKGSPKRGLKNKKNKKKKKQEQVKPTPVGTVPPAAKITVETVTGEFEDGGEEGKDKEKGEEESLQSVNSEYGLEGDEEELLDGKP